MFQKIAALFLVGLCAACGAGAPAVADDSPSEPSVSVTVKPKGAAENYTKSQKNAIRSAKSYLEMSGFSKAGLIEQLSSEYGDGYSKEDAAFAVAHLKVDWNAEAVESAQSYLDMTGFSRKGLIEQLHSPSGDKYTLKQATYAADKVGL